MIKLGIFLNNSVNPDRNPPNTLKSKLKETHVDGIAGMIASGAVNPTKVKMTPIIAVASNPKNTAAGNLRTYKTKVITIPINASNTGGEAKLPKVIRVDGLATTIPAFAKPKNARKNPIPAPIASFKS